MNYPIPKVYYLCELNLRYRLYFHHVCNFYYFIKFIFHYYRFRVMKKLFYFSKFYQYNLKSLMLFYNHAKLLPIFVCLFIKFNFLNHNPNFINLFEYFLSKNNFIILTELNYLDLNYLNYILFKNILFLFLILFLLLF